MVTRFEMIDELRDKYDKLSEGFKYRLFLRMLMRISDDNLQTLIEEIKRNEIPAEVVS